MPYMRLAHKCSSDFQRDFSHRSTELKQKRDYAPRNSNGGEGAGAGGDFNGVSGKRGSRRLDGGGLLHEATGSPDGDDEAEVAADARPQLPMEGGGGGGGGGGGRSGQRDDAEWPVAEGAPTLDWNTY